MKQNNLNINRQNHRKVQVVIIYYPQLPPPLKSSNAPPAIAEIAEVLLLKTNPKRGSFWQNVTGSVEKNEDFLAAAQRELREETGIADSVMIDLNYSFSFQNFQGDPIEERTFLSLINNRANLPPIKIDPHEHSSYLWKKVSTIKAEDYYHLSNYQVFSKALSLITTPVSSNNPANNLGNLGLCAWPILLLFFLLDFIISPLAAASPPLTEDAPPVLTSFEELISQLPSPEKIISAQIQNSLSEEAKDTLEKELAMIKKSPVITVAIKKDSILIDSSLKNFYRLPLTIITKIYSQADKQKYYYLAVDMISSEKQLSYKLAAESIVEIDKISNLKLDPYHYTPLPPKERFYNQRPKITLYSQHSLSIEKSHTQVPSEIANSDLKGMIFANRNSLFLESIFPFDLGASIAIQAGKLCDQEDRSFWEKSLLIGPIIQTKGWDLFDLEIKAYSGVEKSLISNLENHGLSSHLFFIGFNLNPADRPALSTWFMGVAYYQQWFNDNGKNKSSPFIDAAEMHRRGFTLNLGYKYAFQKI